jgi:hypothetical protein
MARTAANPVSPIVPSRFGQWRFCPEPTPSLVSFAWQVDPDQEVALRRLRAAFGFVEILEIVDHHDDQAQDDGEPLDEGEQPPPADRLRQLAGGALRRYTTRWRWFGYGRSSW